MQEGTIGRSVRGRNSYEYVIFSYLTVIDCIRNTLRCRTVLGGIRSRLHTWYC
jgi:hypothetical protein